MFMHTATVETFLGNTPTGPSYADPVQMSGLLDDGVIVEDSPGGKQLVNSTKFFTDLSNAEALTPESRFSCNGRSMIVDSIRRRDGGSLLAAVTHLEVAVRNG